METSKQTTENTIDLRRLLHLLRAHLMMIIVWALGLGVLGFALAQFAITPRYTASTQILVNQKRGTDPNAAYAAQQADVNLINTYKDIITSPVILKDASKWLANPTEVVKPAVKAKYTTLQDGTRRLVRKAQPAEVRRVGRSYDISANELSKSVKVATQQNSQVFTLSATSDDPQQARAIANAVARSFKNKIKSIMNVNNVTIVAEATTPQNKSFPNTKLFTLAGILLGLIISVAWIIIRDSMNTTVRDDSYLTDELGLVNLGQVSHFKLSNKFNINDNTSNNKHRRI